MIIYDFNYILKYVIFIKIAFAAPKRGKVVPTGNEGSGELIKQS